jgi:hypothetical protein
MPHNALEYFRSDERPEWVPTVRVNGVYDDMTTGYTFVVLVKDGHASPVITKTTNITGGTGGTATVRWTTNELDIPPGSYRAILTATRTSDNAQWTVEEQLIIRSR